MKKKNMIYSHFVDFEIYILSLIFESEINEELYIAYFPIIAKF